MGRRYTQKIHVDKFISIFFWLSLGILFFLFRMDRNHQPTKVGLRMMIPRLKKWSFPSNEMLLISENLGTESSYAREQAFTELWLLNSSRMEDQAMLR